jgi:hypothetical protein
MKRTRRARKPPNMGGMKKKTIPEAEGILPDCMTSHPRRQYTSQNTVLYTYVMFVKTWF